MTEPLDITWLEQAWQEYQESKGSGLLRLMGEQAGLLLQEIRILRTQVEGLQATLEEERQHADYDWLARRSLGQALPENKERHE